MTLPDFIEANTEEIDEVIRAACGADYDIADDERESWVSDDEYLYQMALGQGVDV